MKLDIIHRSYYGGNTIQFELKIQRDDLASYLLELLMAMKEQLTYEEFNTARLDIEGGFEDPIEVTFWWERDATQAEKQEFIDQRKREKDAEEKWRGDMDRAEYERLKRKFEPKE